MNNKISANKTRKIRTYIGSYLWKQFHSSSKWTSDFKSTNKLWVHNLLNTPCKLTTSCSYNAATKKPKTFVKLEDWMDKAKLNQLYLWIKQKDLIFSSDELRSTNDNIFISFKYDLPKKSLSEQLRHFIKIYKTTKDVDTKSDLLGGARKYLSAKKETLKQIFQESFIDKLIKDFNSFNITHNNKNGEENRKKSGEIFIKHKNNKFNKLTQKQLSDIYDKLVQNLDMVLYADEINNLK